MINLDKGIIKNTKEYEDLGENIFPIELLTEDEKKELGILKKCCGTLGSCSKGTDKNSSCCKSKKNSCCKK